jgi:hypothetical protein
MSRPRHIPLRGDVTEAVVADLLVRFPISRRGGPHFNTQHYGFPDPFKARLIFVISYFTMYGVGERLA